MTTDPTPQPALRDRELDATTAALVVTSLGEPIRSSTLRTWRVRGRLISHTRDSSGRPLYRLGDVLDLAQARHREVPPSSTDSV